MLLQESDQRRIVGGSTFVLRTLGKLAAIGLVQLREENRRTVPTVLVGKLRIEIDPCAMTDRVEVG